jgi:hypothetical protein
MTRKLDDTEVTFIIGASGTLARLEKPHQAAQLPGAAEAIQETLGMGITAADELDYQRTRGELQAQVGHPTVGKWAAR